MITIKDVSYGGFKADAHIDEEIYKKIREDIIEEIADNLAKKIIQAAEEIKHPEKKE